MSITILVADDQPLMRTALRMSLSAEPDFEVVGEAGDGIEVLEKVERLRPDVVVMDVRMPRLDGIAATSRLTSANNHPLPKVLAITTFDLDEYVVEALRAGASGFLLKDATPEELAHAVRVVADGNALLAPTATRRLLEQFAHRLPTPSEDGPVVSERLTGRELAVLRLVARGRSNAEIAEELHLAESSVKTHVSHLLSKLGLTGRVQLVIYAYESGLVQRRTV